LKELFQNLNFWAVIGTFFAAVTALIIAIWSEWFKTLFFEPKLEILYEHKWPDVLKSPLKQINLAVSNSSTESNGFGVCYFFRFRIKNKGNRTANNVEVIVRNIEQKNINGKFKRYDKFIPLNLAWSFENGKKSFDRINPGMEKHCDLGYILHPQQKQINELLDRENQERNSFGHESNILFIMSFVVKPNIQQSYALAPGHYKIELVAMASNAKMETGIFEIKFDEKWSDDF